MNIYVDIDNTICKTIGTDYKGALPIEDNIKKVNKLYENNTIVGGQHVEHYRTKIGLT